MSTSKIYQQSLADVGSETRPPMLERGDALLHYDPEMELMNMILLSIPNDIYNSVDACTSAKDMWKRVELEKDIMLGIVQSQEFGTRNTSWNKCCWQIGMKLGEIITDEPNEFLFADSQAGRY
ncbi:hypothetical protein Tco_0185809 [Tanacetum coccineum]